MAADTKFIKRRAPALYVIIAIKFLKGALFVTLAIVVYALSDHVNAEVLEGVAKAFDQLRASA